MGSVTGSLEEHLLDKAEDKRGAGEANHVNVGSTAVRRESRTDAEDGTGEACNCLPSVSLYHVFRDHHISPGMLPHPGHKALVLKLTIASYRMIGPLPLAL